MNQIFFHKRHSLLPSHLIYCLQTPKMVELPDWLSALSVFQKSARNAWHLIHCLKSRHLIQGHNLTHILPWICFHIRKPSFFRSLVSNPNLRKSPEIRHFSAFDFISLTSRQPSPHGSIPSDWCQVLCPFAETYPVKKETGPRLLKPRIHNYKQMQSVTKMTSISRSWPSKSTETNRYKAFSTYIMQGDFTLLLSATVSTVETVKAAQLLHNSSTLSTNLPYTRRELSCRISPSRPGIRSLFLCAFF